MQLTNTQNIDKQYLLDHSDDGFDFYDFVLDDLQMTDQSRCKNIHNPFYEDGNPSFCISYSNDMWWYYDYGEPDFKGNVFSFAALYYKLDVKKDFKRILLNMYHDLNIPVPVAAVNDIVFQLGFHLPNKPFNDLIGLNEAHEYYCKSQLN